MAQFEVPLSIGMVESTPLITMLGTKIIVSPLLPSQSIIYIGHWLDSYRPSKHRSQRLIKKLTQGTRTKPSIVRKMQEERETHAFQVGDTFVCSQKAFDAIKSETKDMRRV